MNNKDQPNMQSITSLVKFLVDAWRGSKCPDNDSPYSCTVCKYNAICRNIDELSKVVYK